MLGVMLLIVTLLAWPYQPLIGALALWGAACASKSWTGDGEDAIALLLFYGALGSFIAMVVLGE